MTIEQLKSLDDDELCILWFCINKTTPPVMSFELEPQLFVCIKHKKLVDRLNQCEKYIKSEHKDKFNSLRTKLNISFETT